MADDAGRMNEVLAETSFLYGGNAGLRGRPPRQLGGRPRTRSSPPGAAFFASPARQRRRGEAGGRRARLDAEPPRRRPRPDWLSAIDGLWPAVEAKLEAKIVERAAARASARRRSAPRTLDSLRAIMMIRAYRMRGHLEANLDPLGLAATPGDASELDPATLRLRREPTTTGRSSSTSCWGWRPRRSARSWRSCGAPTAATSACSTCTSPIPARRPGCSSASRAATRRSPSPRRARSPSSRS